jgi:hypothetical protein
MYVDGEQNKPTILKTLVMGQLPEGRRRKGRLEMDSETRLCNGDLRAAAWKEVRRRPDPHDTAGPREGGHWAD